MPREGPRITTPEEFYRALFGRCKDCILTITTLPDSAVHHYSADQLDQYIEDILRLGQNTDTYHNVNSRYIGIGEHERGRSTDVSHLCAVHADFDISGPAHSEQDLPKSAEDVLVLLDELPLKSTVVINTGYGIHAYWILYQPVYIEDGDNRSIAERTLSGLGNFFIERSRAHGWKLDNVFDLARMLRAPGSNNFKLDTPVQCRIIQDSGIYYDLEDFAEYIAPPESDYSASTETAFQADSRTMGSAERIMERCAVAQLLTDDPEGVSEPLWHALCSNIALAPDGYELFHAWSSPYSGYTAEETNYKISRAQKERKPCTCAYFRDKLGCSCPEGGCGVTAPIAHAILTKDEQLEILLSKEKITLDDILDSYALGLLAHAKKHNPVLYTKCKLRARKLGIGSRDFDSAVRQESDKQIVPEFEIEPTEIDLDGLSLNGAKDPTGYRVTDDGVSQIGPDGTYYPVCAEPLVIQRRMENIDTGMERMELTFRRNCRWKTLVAPRSDLLNKNTIIRYADHGLPVTSCNSESVVYYLTKYENENTALIPFTKSISRIGWMGKEFYPYAVDQEIVYEDAESADLINAMEPYGDYAVWLGVAEELRKSPFARFILAASFASVLLEPLQHRVILLHCWHSSRSGKTAALKFALSVWGDPLRLMGSFNSTAVGMERRAGILRHLPMGLDELQVLNEYKLSPAQIVYSLGNGIGKTRGSRNGKLQETPTWRNCVISTGEQPLTRENSMDGVNTRVLELYGQPIADPDFGRDVHQISENNYGFAGKIFIRYLQQEVLPKRGALRKEFKEIRDALKDRCSGRDPGVHLDNIAVFALADYYSSLALFDEQKEVAWTEALALGAGMIDNAKSLERQDTVERAWDFVADWIAANHNKFFAGTIECYGVAEQGKVYVLANKLRQALENDGYSYTKCMKGFRERGYLLTAVDSDGRERNQWQKRIQGVNTRAICLNLSISPTDFDDEDFLA